MSTPPPLGAPKANSSGLVLFAILQHSFLLVSAIFAICGSVTWSDDKYLYFALCGLFAIASTVFDCLILHRGWSAVQDGQTTVTPGKAVGFCFIPLFSFYWVFVAHVGLMRQFNRVLDSRGKSSAKVVEGLALTYAILFILGSLFFFLAPIALGFRVATIWQTIRAVKELEVA